MLAGNAHVDEPRTNIPAERTSFIGRAADLTELEGLIAHSRLLTISGPPGVGKTRVAQQLGRAHLQRTNDEVWFCDLGLARNSAEILAVVGDVLQARLTQGETPRDLVTRIGEVLLDRGPLLLILDNFEQLVEAGPETVGRWLDMAKDTRIVVTSRVKLGLHGEVRYELAPLSPENAVTLFQQRARAAGASWSFAENQLELVHTIVARLDSLPLAIELAAARAPVLSPATLLERLSRRFDVLKSSLRDRPARQLSLRTAIDDSWALLGSSEQATLMQCSAFRGGFTVEAAEAVVQLPDPEGDCLEILQELHDKSLLLVSTATEQDGQTRFGMVESIRAYAEEKLSATKQQRAVEQRHAHFFLLQGAKWVREASGRRGADVVAASALERSNLIAAHRRELDDNPQRAARAVLALDPLFIAQGPFNLHLELLDSACEAAERSAERALQAEVLVARANLKRILGRRAEALTDGAAAIELAKSERCAELEVEALLTRALVHWAQRSIDDAQGELDEALTLCGSLDGVPVEGKVLRALGFLEHFRRRSEEARALYERALVLHRRNGDVQQEAITIMYEGLLKHDVGHHKEARAKFDQSLNATRESADPSAEAVALSLVGTLNLEQGLFEQSRRDHEQALERHRAVGHRSRTGWSLLGLALVACSELNATEAMRCGKQALAVGEKIDREARLIAWCHTVIGVAHALEGAIKPADASFTAARASMAGLDLGVAGGALEIYASFLDIAKAHDAHQTGNESAVQAHLDVARGRIAAASQPGPPSKAHPQGRPCACEQSGEVRIAVQTVGDALLRASCLSPEATMPPDTLLVAKDGSWFRPPGGSMTELTEQPLLCTLLRALLVRRLAEPNTCLSTEALIRMAWPDEQILPEAAANRLYVAIARLRKKGLSTILLTRKSGYCLDPQVPVRRLPAQGIHNPKSR